MTDIICIDGFQYVYLGDGNYALIMDEEGNPLKEDVTVKRWVKAGQEYTLVNGLRQTKH